MRWRFRPIHSSPVLVDSVAQGRIATADQRDGAVFHHRNQFRRGLSEVQRNNNQSLGHRGQIKRHPANTVGRQQSAAVALIQSPCSEKSAGLADHFEKFTTGHTRDLTVADLLQHRGVRGDFELRKDFSNKWHEFSYRRMSGFSYKPTPTVEARRSSAADNLPNSSRRCAW